MDDDTQITVTLKTRRRHSAVTHVEKALTLEIISD